MGFSVERRRLVLRLGLLGLLGVLGALGVACKKSAPPDPTGAAPAPVATSRWFRIELATATAATPAFLRLPDATRPDPAVIRLGGRDQPVAVTWRGDEFEVRFGAMPAVLKGQSAAGKLTGTWGAASATFDGATRFEAAPSAGPDADHLFALAGTPSIGRPTVWKLTLPDSGEVELRLDPGADGRVQGFWQFARGDSAELLGEARGNEIALAGFDGVHAYLCLAEVADDGSIAGTWQIVYAGVRTVTEEFTGAAGSLPRGMGPALPETRRPLTIPDVDLSRFLGQPTIVELAGSWCPTCREMGPVWRRIYDTYSPQGLKLVTLSYEFTDDAAHNAAAAAAFAKAYDMTWEVIPMGGDLDDLAASFPSEYGDLCFPVAFFVDRAGLVQSAKCGFAPDGPHGAANTADLEAEVRRLLTR